MRSTTDQSTYVCFPFVVILSSLLFLTPSFGQSADLQAELEEIEVEPMARGPVHEAFAEPIELDQDEVFLVPRQPPEAIEELPPDGRPEGDGVVWIPGYWSWDDERTDFIWISGVWRYAPVGRAWVPGQWQSEGANFRWIPGYWAPTAGISDTQVNRVPLPPASLENGPNREPPSENHFWIPGSWQYQTDRYAWRPGFWSACHDDWVWVPDQYVPLGDQCVYVPGYWDYGWEQRGVLYAPCYIDYRQYVGRRYAYRPQVAINTSGAFLHLWVRPSYRHYYFGDYYDSRYLGFGIRPWYSYHRSFYRAYDPLFVHYNWRYGRDHISLHQQFRGHHNHYRNNVAARPQHTFRRGTNAASQRGSAHAQLAFRASELNQRNANANRRNGLKQVVVDGGRGANVVRNGNRFSSGPAANRSGRGGGNAVIAGQSPAAVSGRAAAQARNAGEARNGVARDENGRDGVGRNGVGRNGVGRNGVGRDGVGGRVAESDRGAGRNRGPERNGNGRTAAERDGAGRNNGEGNVTARNAAAQNAATPGRNAPLAKGALVGKAAIAARRGNTAAASIEALNNTNASPQPNRGRQSVNGGTRSRQATGEIDRPAYGARQAGPGNPASNRGAATPSTNGRGANGIARDLSNRSTTGRAATATPDRRPATRANQQPVERSNTTRRANVVTPDVSSRRASDARPGRTNNASRAAAAAAVNQALASQNRSRSRAERPETSRSAASRTAANPPSQTRPTPQRARAAAAAAIPQRNRATVARPASNRPNRAASVSRQNTPTPRPQVARPAPARQPSRPQQIQRAMSRNTMPQRGGAGRPGGGNRNGNRK